MKLKLNLNAVKETLVQRDVIAYSSIAGITGQAVTGINSGIDIGGGNHASSFVENMAGQAYGPSPARGLFLYKGTPPTQAELDAFYVAGSIRITLNEVFRYSDLLINYIPSSQSVSQGSIVDTFSPANAIASGTATWFIFGAFASSDYIARPNYLVSGTVTGPGGGGDIELIETNIVAGNAYRMPPYELKLPSKFST